MRQPPMRCSGLPAAKGEGGRIFHPSASTFSSPYSYLGLALRVRQGNLIMDWPRTLSRARARQPPAPHGSNDNVWRVPDSTAAPDDAHISHIGKLGYAGGTNPVPTAGASGPPQTRGRHLCTELQRFSGGVGPLCVCNTGPQ
jgi:hypothetical protein